MLNGKWELFLRSYFPKEQRLGEVLTLTGTGFDAQVLSCRDYLTTTWPEIGGLLINGLESLMSSTNEGKSERSLIRQCPLINFNL